MKSALSDEIRNEKILHHLKLSFLIRKATPDDAHEILAIYAPYVLNSAVSFELDLPSEDEMKQRMLLYMEKYPWLVAVSGNEVIGYAYASAYRERKAYQWSCESSVYVHSSYFGKGVGDCLYEELIRFLTIQGLRNIYAVITLPNDASERFHTRNGFTPFSVFKNVGYKFSQWHDVLWMQRSIEQEGPVKDPIWFSQLT